MHVYKQFEKDNISISSFKAYKSIYVTSQSVNDAESTCIYQASYKPANTEINQLLPSTYNTYQFLAYNSLYNKYYKDHLRNPDPLVHYDQVRYLPLTATIFSIPQNIFGEQIKPGSVAMTVNGLNLIDDKIGNLICTNYITASMYEEFNQKLIGRWAFNDSYIQQINTIFDYTPFNNDGLSYNVTYSSSVFNTGSDVSVCLTSASRIEIPHVNHYNFNDYTLSFNIQVTDNATTKLNIIRKGDTTLFPFNVYISGSNLFAEQSNGKETSIVSSSYATGSLYNFTLVRNSASLALYSNGVLSSYADCNINETFNSQSIFIGANSASNGFTGYLNDVNLYNSAFTSDQCALYSGQIYPSQSYYINVGNVMYTEGIIAITSPFTPFNNLIYDTSSFSLQCNGTKTIYEHEYVCTVKSNELTLSTNPSTYNSSYNYLSFVTHSDFSPLVTAIGLYDDNYDLVAIAKLSKAVKMPKSYDINFIVRFDL